MIFAILRTIIIFVPWLLYLFVVDILLSLLLPFSFFFTNTVYDVSSWLAGSVWTWLQAIFINVNGAIITISGSKIPHKESAIVIANHVSWGDVFMIQALAIHARMLGRCRYFAKIELRWVPFLGWGVWAIGMPMVSRKWMKDKSELDRVFSGIVNNNWPTWLVSYSEGTRITPKKREEAKLWCKEHDKPLPQHLLYPRTKGFVTTVQHLRQAKHIKAIYDVTIAYQRGDQFQTAPSMWEILSVSNLTGSGFKFHADMQRIPIEDIPTEDKDIAKWLEQRWILKGEFLESKRIEWSKA